MRATTQVYPQPAGQRQGCRFSKQGTRGEAPEAEPRGRQELGELSNVSTIFLNRSGIYRPPLDQPFPTAQLSTHSETTGGGASKTDAAPSELPMASVAGCAFSLYSLMN